MTARCESCSSESLTLISMTMTDGHVVDFESCHRCEHKRWSTSGQNLSLDRVLTMATRRK